MRSIDELKHDAWVIHADCIIVRCKFIAVSRDEFVMLGTSDLIEFDSITGAYKFCGLGVRIEK